MNIDKNAKYEGFTLSVGSSHILIKDGDRIWAAGSNEYGQLGCGFKDQMYSAMQKVEVKTNKIFNIYANYDNSTAISEDGTLWMWGSKWTKDFDPSIEIGEIRKQFTPKSVDEFKGKKIIMGSNGKYHAVFVTDDNNIHTFGYNNLGQLGNGEYGQLGNVEIFKHIPQVIESLCQVKTVSCGFNFTVLLSKEGKVFTWGTNDKGQLGQGVENQDKYKSSPQQVKKLDEIFISSISVGEGHIFVITADQKALYWGDGLQGQLGNGEWGVEFSPTLFKFSDQKLKSVSCGFTHTIIELEDKSIWATGTNFYGELGVDSLETLNAPERITFFDSKTVLNIGCGEHFSVLICSDGIYAFGNNNNGQLCLENNQSFSTPHKVHYKF
eukprot:TRINITY_DN4419_c0_g1_i2.p1 TRINITY_DN4419_c0_g1~~TRINITY_DN4419_c0_g1_i2.p1  ORF type:complete len:381 (+),score=77.42 TRINITY_DN4419_c0_g1_i2:229-1371(+)